VLNLLSDHSELFKQFSDSPNFKRWLTDMVFDATYLARPLRPGRASTVNASPT
jgi:type I restriction enzyme R subunit